MRRKCLRVFAASVLVSSALVPVGRTADAAGAVCSTSGGYFAGWSDYSRAVANADETPVGVSAFIRHRTGLLCGSAQSTGATPSKFTTAWVMLFNNGPVIGEPSHSGGLAQAGFFRARPNLTANSCNYIFSEWHRYGGAPFDGVNGRRIVLFAQGCIADGTDKAYRVTRMNGGVPSGSAGPVQMSTGLGGPGTFILDTTPFDINIWSIWTPGYAGEVIYRESDIPGSAGAPTELFSMGIQSKSTGGFIPTPCYLRAIAVDPRFAEAAIGCDHILVWTQ